MKMKLCITILSGLALASALLGPAAGARAENRDIAWIDDLEEGRTLAAREGKPLFIVFR